MEETMWKYSTLLDPEMVKKTGCFTILPVRINNRNDIPDAASMRVLKDWADHTGNTNISSTRLSISPVGSFCSLIYCETIPERLDSISYLTDLFFLIDDATEKINDNLAAQAEEWAGFSGAMTEALGEVRCQPDHDLEFMKKKKLTAKVMLDFLSIDPELGLDLVKSCKAGWTPLAAGVEWANMDEYLTFRRDSAGLDIYWGKTVFGLGEKLTDNEEKLIRPLVWAAEKAAMLNNDYWSWDLEYAEANGSIEQLTNAVAVLMNKEGITAQEAKERVKDLIIGFEAEYLALRDQFYKSHPSARLYLRKRVELAGSMAAGVSFWSANSPRYHLPKPEQQQKDQGLSETEKFELAAITSCSETTSHVDYATNKDGYVSAPSDNTLDDNKSTGTGLSPQSSCTSQEDTGGRSLSPSYLDVPKLSKMALDGPIDYVTGMPSKGVRKSLIDAMNQWFQVPSSQLAVVKDVIDQLHNSSLILDDIQDDSPLRRGKTATHLIFGQAQSINSANFMYVRVVQQVHAVGNPALMKVVLEELEDLHIGQSWDLYWKYNLRWPTETEYFSMIDLKTGGLFRMLVRMMQVLSPLKGPLQHIACDKLVSMVSRFFQVRDDYLNLRSSQYSTQKGWCEDLDEGKFSYLIIDCLEKSPKFRDRILGFFRQRVNCAGPMPNEGKVQIIEYLQEAGSFEACWGLLNSLENEIEGEITRLEEDIGEENPLLHLLLKLLSVKNEKPGRKGDVVPAVAVS